MRTAAFGTPHNKTGRSFKTLHLKTVLGLGAACALALMGASASAAPAGYAYADTEVADRPSLEARWSLPFQCKRAFSGQGLDDCSGELRIQLTQAPPAYRKAVVRCTSELQVVEQRSSAVENRVEQEQRLERMEHMQVVALNQRQGVTDIQVRKSVGSLIRPVVRAWVSETTCSAEWQR